jgi:hypothetical protein
LTLGASPSANQTWERWGKWFGKKENGVIRETAIGGKVFSLDRLLRPRPQLQLSDRRPAVLLETMIFGGRHDQYKMRYSSRAEALKGHEVAVALAKGHA